MDFSPPQNHPPISREAEAEARTDFRAEDTTESIGSVSGDISEKKRDSGQQSQGDAKWPPENEVVFVNVLLDEVVMGNRVACKFTPNQWATILAKFKEQCPIHYPYKVAQLQSKYQRMKANPSYHDMEGKVCVHYEALMTIFHGTTATGSNARASTQRVTEGRGEPSGMETPTSHRWNAGQNQSVRRRRSTKSSFDTAMYSWSDLNVSLKEKKQQTREANNDGTENVRPPSYAKYGRRSFLVCLQ
ncbi:Unknown protein [Striga hermonthica]|uniref:Myb/SANT-like domain-containing protein n=1 Tax=Striga hermonthica TaxID=68872 RepID=A0A9N7RIJ1_STRHE|nr:Unknown protein [Striga hermonthica]